MTCHKSELLNGDDGRPKRGALGGSEIRCRKLEKTFREQGTLSQAVVRIVNEAARDQEGNGDARGSPTPQK